MTPCAFGSLLLAVLIVSAVVPAAAIPDDSSSTVAPGLLGLPGVPDLLQEKSKLQWDWVKFKQEGDRLYESGNYEEAVKHYTMAEGLLLEKDPDRRSTTESSLANLETMKSSAYQKWGGHDAEAQKSARKAQELRASADAKGRAEASGSYGCLIVTATYGSPLASEVQLVRTFRDESIAKSYTGSRFMPGFNAWYYSFSPQVSAYINEHPVVKPVMQILIMPVLEIVLLAQVCWTFLSFNPELATITAIIVGSALYGLVYVFPTVMAGIWIARRRGWEGTGIRNIWPAAAAWVLTLLLLMTGIFLSLDDFTTIASGLFVIVTIILVVAGVSLSLLPYIGRSNTSAQK
ncbi:MULTISPECIES: CFI-box-CTERM domain-containing protein [unclassified Methanoregula]|uniref:CFI-box-CTERM domain-containing protein n=1 Tax=unclassified Methanoregula TaxID=2649730 RepID=UPI0025F8897E|nr:MULTISPECIES: CFI-box-CTERM domain-containing protein [unclassified Methanoregula]